jgi:hypothetical protein
MKTGVLQQYVHGIVRKATEERLRTLTDILTEAGLDPNRDPLVLEDRRFLAGEGGKPKKLRGIHGEREE